MKTTLAEIVKIEEKKGKSLLEVKRNLLTQKKKGMIFFHENMLELGLEDEFQLYFVYTPSSHSAVNAFPIPIGQFKWFKNSFEQFGHLKNFYENYYQNAQMKEEDFNTYQSQKPYIGEQYVWYYKIIG